MLGHLSFGVTDLDRAITFYDPVMAALGHVRLWQNERGAGYGPPGGNDRLALFLRPGAHPPGEGFHLAFRAESQAAVDAFHKAALAHGGADLGAPGLRPHYSPTYYAAFVTDPEGWKLEAVFQ
ncbi:VOC family protein [Oceanibaculum indicum]|uniref:Catechol 2,3-dioxygenase-like lactoylglutathione lyase family enzyme n=1 Tax=Oceanibaculum indicum TaxID=526216 RepID=A0A420WGW8_9PROT|nr:VOC family protein [Oceanibaculum indicum]RKQ70233.1 catechol 2,3-dioxygenase-like lactoylglutathione lyase family enzyme [Oceanibaculum indicum]